MLHRINELCLFHKRNAYENILVRYRSSCDNCTNSDGEGPKSYCENLIDDAFQILYKMKSRQDRPGICLGQAMGSTCPINRRGSTILHFSYLKRWCSIHRTDDVRKIFQEFRQEFLH
ncbi:hypothetical protein CDAR_17761 [Caerostris darwini]|uniref:Uncharacterized protein n=1 Tax=Caerostris darwini TaxID=1538125 RepID=A0AAV4MBR9_9ARAC|nr:hypothetical protein CDAR_17761 [Caerostris darwini]